MAESKYKIVTAKFDQNMEVDNKLNWGLRLDMDVFSINKNSSKAGAHFGLGAQYQVSKYLSNGNSFKPFFAYFRFGINIQ